MPGLMLHEADAHPIVRTVARRSAILDLNSTACMRMRESKQEKETKRERERQKENEEVRIMRKRKEAPNNTNWGPEERGTRSQLYCLRERDDKEAQGQGARRHRSKQAIMRSIRRNSISTTGLPTTNKQTKKRNKQRDYRHNHKEEQEENEEVRITRKKKAETKKNKKTNKEQPSKEYGHREGEGNERRNETNKTKEGRSSSKKRNNAAGRDPRMMKENVCMYACKRANRKRR